MSILEDYETRLNKSGDEIIHLVSAYNVAHDRRIAYCGHDCSGRTWKEPGSANCVVCIDIADNERRLRDEWLDSLMK
jgi:elongation factor P hydroxylase